MILLNLFNKIQQYNCCIHENYIIINNIKWCYLDNKIKNDNRQIIIFFHGFQGNKNLSYYPLIKQLNNKYRILIPDLIEHGNTKVIQNKYNFNYSINNQLIYLYNFINTIIPNTYFNLIGTSMGGLFVSLYNIKYPLYVKKIILMNTCGIYNKNNILLKIYKDTGKLLLFPNNIYEFNILITLLLYKKSLFFNDYILSQLLKENIKQREIYIQIFKFIILNNLNILDHYLPLINKPITFIWGYNDQITSIHTLLKIKDNLKYKPNINIINKCNHIPHYEYPELCSNIIKNTIN